ncbi:hypothetical protein M758_1G054100 [Ceratodon purpureus]|nr:hypothetical protein M758_1G054100 [Ceratodon purpureus]
MKGSVGRSRSMRGAESPQRERDPFGLGLRQKSSPVVEASRRRGRGNGENVAPVENVPELPSPGPCKPNSKVSKTPSVLRESTVVSSPALMPKVPKPSPARNTMQPLSQNQGALNQVAPQGPGPDQGNGTRRKLNLDVQAGGVVESLMNAAVSDPNDTGVKVIVRMRPLNKKEIAEEATHVISKLSPNSLSLVDQQFTYDAVAGDDESQQAVFDMVGLPMVENCLAGFNSSIFAYGQTGSGKTHTMWGPMPDSGSELMATEERGVTPRVFEQLFSRIQQEERNNVDKQLRYQCRCSFLEIYNEQITDLLEPSQKNLMIREDTKTGVYVEGLSEEYVSNLEDVTRLLIRGLANRRVSSTAMNNESSRSHSVFTFVIESRSKSAAEGASSVRTSRMNLVDLAGSERQKQTGAAGERLKEAGNINKSLSQLGNVINILAEVAQNGKHRHIPYRDSRLTFLLQESLGGNAKLAMICAVSPASSCKTETLSTLRFAQRAKAMQNKAVVNEETANDVNLLREQIRQLKDELMRMKENNNQPEGVAAGGFTTGWNARRSYNLLKLSLGQPMTISSSEIKDIDKELELRPEVCEEETESLPNCKSTLEVQAILPSLNEEQILDCVAEESDGFDQQISMQCLSAAPDTTQALITPTHSVSPNVKEVKKEPSLELSSGLPKSPLSGAFRISKAFASTTDQLAASLTRGIEILDNQPRNSVSFLRRSAGVQFTFQNEECSMSRREAMLLRLTSSCNAPFPGQSRDVECTPDKKMRRMSPQPESPSGGDLSPWPQITLEDSCKILAATPPVQKQRTKALEALLVGAARREKVAEDRIAQQSAEIEQLNRLVCQYKLERECNAVLQQSREEKIARMESLMDGVLPSEEFQKEEWAALKLEHKILQEKFDQHPALAEAIAQQELLRHELEEYKSFCDLRERDFLHNEVTLLRNQLAVYLESETSRSLKQRRLSHPIKNSLASHPSADAALEEPSNPSSAPHNGSNLISDATMQGSDSRDTEMDQNEQDGNEDLHVLVQELKEERDHYIQLAERGRKELEGEKRCSQEMHDALQMAMTGHARLLDQYAELQEKHIILVSKMRVIRDGVANIKTVAKKSGLTCTEDRWFDAQAAQIAHLKAEQEQSKEEIKGLQSQLRDTADAVQAAGELVVRLKDAELAAVSAKEEKVAVELNVVALRRKLEVLERDHVEEMSTLQQCLREFGSQLCSLCGASTALEAIKDSHNVQVGNDREEDVQDKLALGASSTGVTESHSSALSDDNASDADSLVTIPVTILKGSLKDQTSVLESWSSGKDEGEDNLGFDEDGGIEMRILSRKGYQYLRNSESEEFEDDIEDDEFLCETCGLPATNGMRVCDLCI